MSIYLEYYFTYILIGTTFVLINCFIAGYKGEQPTFTDCLDVFIWPLTLAALFGQLTKLTFLLIKTLLKKLFKKSSKK